MCKKHFAHFRFVMHFLEPLEAIPTLRQQISSLPSHTATWNTQYANNPRIYQVYLPTSYYSKSADSRGGGRKHKKNRGVTITVMLR